MSQPTSSSITIFTLYRGTQELELHLGYEDRAGLTAIRSCKSHDVAYQFAQAAANHRGVELRDFTRSKAKN